MNRIRKARMLGALPLVVVLGACNILTVRDPGRYDEEDLDDALEAVANTVEGSAQGWVDWYVNWQSLQSDVFMFTGYSFYENTWGFIDEGRVDYGTYPTSGVNSTYWKTNFPDGMVQARWFARESWDRLSRVLGESVAMSDVMGAQVLLGDAILDMYGGLFSCETVLEKAPSPMFADIQVYYKAAETFGRALEVALNIDPEVLEDVDVDYANAARTGRALMLMLGGDYEAAAAEAAAVPDGFTYNAIHSRSFISYNDVYRFASASRVAGLMEWLWPRIDQTFSPSYIRDEFTGEHDKRMPVWYRGWTGTDFETPHYNQWKYDAYDAEIPMLHSGHARLIEAEAKAMSDDFAGAMAILNNLRSRVGLDPRPVPINSDDMLDVLLEERFAELFMEGHRMVDLHRFDMVRDVFEDMNDPIRRGIGRPSKFPGSQREAQLNPGVEDEKSIRCAPVG